MKNQLWEFKHAFLIELTREQFILSFKTCFVCSNVAAPLISDQSVYFIVLSFIGNLRNFIIGRVLSFPFLIVSCTTLTRLLFPTYTFSISCVC